jgi:hypothetical protein
VQDDRGNIVPGAQITVQVETGGAPLATLYSDRDGAVPLANPFTIGSDGLVAFHAAGGAYRITATSGAFSATWRYKAVGTAAEYDYVEVVSDAAPNLLVNGDFQINQRAFAGGALSAGVYGFDRWKAATGGANCTLSGFVLTLASGELTQVIEPALFGFASFASSTFVVSVDTPSQDLTVTFGTATATIAAGSGRRSATLTTGAGDTGNLSFKIKRASGSGVTFGRIKLEVGTFPTIWRSRTRQAEMALCNRYYQKYVRGADGSSLNGFFAVAIWSGAASGLLPLAVPMRTAPTLTTSALANFWVSLPGVAVQVPTSIQIRSSDSGSPGGPRLMGMIALHAGTTLGSGLLSSNAAGEAWLAFDAEL